jgi:hypothetical protein
MRKTQCVAFPVICLYRPKQRNSWKRFLGSWTHSVCLAVREGLVQRVEGYFDRLGMLQQLGLVPTPGQAS